MAKGTIYHPCNLGTTTRQPTTRQRKRASRSKR